jgi:hypothetical protein
MPKKTADKVIVPDTTTTVTVSVMEALMRPADQIRADIAKLITVDAGFDITVHNVAVECLEHAATHGDFTLLAQLIGDCKTAGGVTFGKGVRSRRLALIEWTTKFSPLRINGDGVMGKLPDTSKTFTPFDVDAATKTPFYDLAGEAKRRTTNSPFDIAVILGRIGSFNAAIDKAVEAGALNDDEAALRTLVKEGNAWFAARARELGLNSDEAKARRTAAA